MDETLRVKIVADTTQVNSSFKQLNKETQGFQAGANAASDAVGQLNKTLSSLGFKTLPLTNLIRSFTDLKKSVKDTGKQVEASLGKEAAKAAENLVNGVGKIPDVFHDVVNSLEELRGSRIRSDVAASNLDLLKNSFNELGKSASEDVKKIGFAFNQIPYHQISRKIKRLNKAWEKEKPLAYRHAVKDLYNSFYNLTTNSTRLQRALDGIKAKLNPLFEQHTLGNRLVTIFKDLNAGARKFNKTIGETFKFLVNLTQKVLTGGLIAGIAGILLAIKNAFSVSKLGDDIDKTSQKVGMGTTAFQKWSYILERCNIDVSTLQTAVRQLTAASMGDKASYFKALGIDPNGKSQQQLFEETITALQNVSDSTQRAKLAYQLFGRASAEIMPLLNITAAEVARLSYQYDLLGATMDGRVVRASVNMRDALTDLKAAFQGLKNTLAQAIMPVLTHIIVRLTVFIAKVNMILQTLFGIEIEYAAVEQSTAQTTHNVEKTVTAVKKLKTLISGFDELNIFPSQDNPNGDIGGLADELGEIASDITPTIGEILPPEAIAELENFRDNILPGIIEKLEKWKEAWNELKEAWKTGDFGEVIKTLLDVTGLDENPFVKKLMEFAEGAKEWWDEHVGGKMLGWEPIDWDSLFNPEDLWDFLGIEIDENSIFDKIVKFFEKVQEWDNVDLFGWELPTSLQDFLGFTEDWHIDWDNILGLDFDFEGSPVGRLVNWWKEDALPVLNTNPFEWLDEQLGIGEWWEENIASITWDDIFADIRADYEDSDLKGIVDDISNWNIWKGSWWSDKFTAIKEAPGKAWSSIKQWWNNNVSSKFTSAFWQGKFQTAAIGLTGVNIPAKVTAVWGTITTWWNTNVKPKFTAEYWKTKFNSIKDGLGNSPILTKAKDTWTSVKNWWDTNIAAKFKMDYWKTKFNTIKDGLGYSSVLTSMKDKWRDVKSWWSDNVASKFTWTYWRDKFNSIKTGLSNVSLVQVAKNIINGLISTIENGLNRMIDKINSSGVIEALKKIGVNISLNRIYIPRLAKGGVIDSPTMAMMGEYPGAKSNPEIVTPENKLTEIFENSNSDIVNVLVQGFRQIIEAIDEKDTSITIGDTTIAKSAARGNNQYRLQTGTSLF